MTDSPSEKNVHHKALMQYSRISFLQAVVYRLPNIYFFSARSGKNSVVSKSTRSPRSLFRDQDAYFFVSVCFAGEAPEAPQKRDVFAEFEALAGIQVSSARSSGECHCEITVKLEMCTT